MSKHRATIWMLPAELGGIKSDFPMPVRSFLAAFEKRFHQTFAGVLISSEGVTALGNTSGTAEYELEFWDDESGQIQTGDLFALWYNKGVIGVGTITE